MKKTAAQRIKELAEQIEQKAKELRQILEGVEANVNTTKNKTTGKPGT